MEHVLRNLINLWRTDRYTFLFFSTVFAFFFWLIANELNLSAESGAAWVQAIGSLFALAIAVYIPLSQRKVENENKSQAKRQEERALGIACVEELVKVKFKAVLCRDLIIDWRRSPSLMHSFGMTAIEMLHIGNYEEIDAIRIDWHRFKVAPESLQLLIHQIREYYRKIEEAQRAWAAFSEAEGITFDSYLSHLQSNLDRILVYTKSSSEYFRPMLRPHPPTQVRIVSG
jgi:hypothetical protein